MANAHQNLLCLFGANGAGKTRMLQQVEELMGEGEVLRTGAERIVADLIDDLNNSGSFNHVSDHLLAIDHLLIDNFWVLASRPNSAAVVRDLIEERTAADRLTILASELTLDQWAARQPAMAAFLGNGTVVQVDGSFVGNCRGE